MDETEFQTFLEPDDILRADRVRAPKGFVKVLSVPSAEFGGAVKYIIKRSSSLENPFHLAELSYVAAGIPRRIDIGAQAKADLVWLMMEIARYNLMSARTKFLYKTGADYTQSARHKNSH
jgi:hypothetical protein